MGHRAEPAVPRTYSVHDHKSCGLFGKALPDIWTFSFLAHGVEAAFFQERTDPFVGRTCWQTPLKPGGFFYTYVGFLTLSHYVFYTIPNPDKPEPNR